MALYKFYHCIVLYCILFDAVFLNLGYGVFVTQFFSKGTFLLDYAGELLATDEAETRDDVDYIYFLNKTAEAIGEMFISNCCIYVVNSSFYRRFLLVTGDY